MYAVCVLLFVLLLSLLTLIQCVSPQSLSEMVQDVFISLEKKITLRSTLMLNFDMLFNLECGSNVIIGIRIYGYKNVRLTLNFFLW